MKLNLPWDFWNGVMFHHFEENIDRVILTTCKGLLLCSFNWVIAFLEQKYIVIKFILMN